MHEYSFEDLPDDCKELLQAAERARNNAYAPYTDHKVGAAVRGRSGRIYSAANVEIVTLQQSVHAERNAVLAMAASGERAIAQLACFGQYAGIPCAECRQVIWEFCGADAGVQIISTGRGEPIRILTMGELYPLPYGPESKNIDPTRY